ncbi:MAG: hypothetical protein RR101_06455 [Burkholderiaceae bacterium]
MTVVRLCLAGAAIASLAACSPKLDIAKATFCQELGSYAQAVNALDALNPNSTVDQFKYQASLVEQTGGQLEAAALVLSNAEAKALAQSRAQFAQAVGSIAGTETVAQADTQIDQAAAKAIDQFIRIDSTVCTYGAGQKK